MDEWMNGRKEGGREEGCRERKRDRGGGRDGGRGKEGKGGLDRWSNTQ